MQCLSQVALLFYLLLFSSVLRAEKRERPRKLLNNVPGGRERCLREISDRASIMRQGIVNTIEELGDTEGAYGYVIRVNFVDGVRWAAKISAKVNRQMIFSGIQASNTIERYCPGIPLPKFHGDIQVIENTDLIYVFMDWMRGIVLRDIVRYHETSKRVHGPRNYTLVETTIPRRTITQLAEFVHNLTTCPLPKAQGIIPRGRY